MRCSPAGQRTISPARRTLPGFDDYVSPFPLLSLSGVLGIAYDELGGA